MVEYRTEYLKISHVNLCSLPIVDIFDNVQTINTPQLSLTPFNNDEY